MWVIGRSRWLFLRDSFKDDMTFHGETLKIHVCAQLVVPKIDLTWTNFETWFLTTTPWDIFWRWHYSPHDLFLNFWSIHFMLDMGVLHLSKIPSSSQTGFVSVLFVHEILCWGKIGQWSWCLQLLDADRRSRDLRARRQGVEEAKSAPVEGAAVAETCGERTTGKFCVLGLWTKNVLKYPVVGSQFISNCVNCFNTGAELPLQTKYDEFNSFCVCPCLRLV